MSVDDGRLLADLHQEHSNINTKSGCQLIELTAALCVCHRTSKNQQLLSAIWLDLYLK